MVTRRHVLTKGKISLSWFLLAVVSINLETDLRAQQAPEASTSVTGAEPLGAFYKNLKDVLGVTYFSIFNGPGVQIDRMDYSPNHLGKASNDGLNFLNQFSLRFKFSKSYALDIQNRFYWILNNQTQNQNYKAIRWEAPRIGISGNLLTGEDWTLNGAINTDFPYFLPSPLSGYQTKQRTVIFDPGMFAKFHYKPKQSRWSVYSIVNPRVFFYKERQAAESQFAQSGFSAGNKPEVILSFQPNLNYDINSTLSLSLGTTFDYRKYISSDWNPLNSSLLTNGDSSAWRLSAVPILLGLTYIVSSDFTFFPYLTVYPIAKQRMDADSGLQTSFLDSTSIGFWISGTFF